jgi:hypothetical protein
VKPSALDHFVSAVQLESRYLGLGQLMRSPLQNDPQGDPGFSVYEGNQKAEAANYQTEMRPR